MTVKFTTLERMPEKIDSKFRFVLLAAERAEQMMQGASPKMDLGNLKPTRVAMEEVLNDLVEWDYGPPPVEEAEDAALDVEMAEETE